MKENKNREAKGEKYKIKIVFLYFLLFTFPFSLFPSLRAEDTIKILMLKSPDDPLPSEGAELIGSLNGKVFINGGFYVGSLEIRKDEKGLYIINRLPLEKYIEGVVASETGKEWELEALKAQAVVSRTYALFYKNLNRGKCYHLTSTVLHQVYKNHNRINSLIKQAVRETKGEILTYNGQPIKAFYHSTCVGKTELPEEVWGESYPYLKSVDCNSKNSPYQSWQRRFTFDEIEEATGIKGIKDIKIASYTSTGRVKTINVIFQKDEMGISDIEIRATELRNLLGYRRLPSTHFSLAVKNGEVIFDGKGWGHGVGLCQWGALEMAREGKDYREILRHYYPGAILKRMEAVDL